jgi:hypothetical protein
VSFIRLLIFAVFGLVSGVSIAGDVLTSNARQSFLVFDGLLYGGKPDLGALGMLPIRGINPPAGVIHPSDVADDGQVRATLKTLHGYSGAVYLDYEIWPTFHASAAEVSQNVEKLKQVVQIAHEAVPGARIGYYDVIPCSDYWGLVNNDQTKIKEWKDCNARMGDLAQGVDIVMPSLYTFYNDPHGWDIYAAALLQAARRYGKPVYAFLWPEFHVSNRFLKGQNIPANFWRHELEFCRTRADGIVIWGGYQKPWDDQAAWWLETKAFLTSLHSR